MRGRWCQGQGREIEKGNAKEVVGFLSKTIDEEVNKRFQHAMELKNYKESDVDPAREYAEALLEFTLYSHKLYAHIKGMKVHEGTAEHKH